VLLTSHFLYHLDDEAASAFLRRAQSRVRCGIVVSELVRGRIASWGFGALAWGLRLSPLTRRDGQRAIARAWTAREFASVLAGAVDAARVHRPDPFRMVGVIPGEGA
jgi:hypothetical protein